MKTNCAKALFSCLIIITGISCNLWLSKDNLHNKAATLERGGEKESNSLERISDVPTKSQFSPDGLQFIDEQHGWFFDNGRLWQTSDGGKTWESIYNGDYEEHEVVIFSFINSRIGWSVSNTKIQTTDDGGYTWKPVTSPITPRKGIIGTLQFLKNGRQGWLAGGIFKPIPPELREYGIKPAYTNGVEALQAVVFYTDDGGRRWKQQNIPSGFGTMISYLSIYDQRTVWAIADNSLYRNADNGRWKKVDFRIADCPNQQLLDTAGISEGHGDIQDIVSISFPDSIHGWLSFENGYLARSTDGGKTWCDLFSPESSQARSDEVPAFSDLYFGDINSGWGLARDGSLYKTVDGGVTWKRVDGDIKFSNMYFLDAANGWLVSEKGIFRIR